MAISDKELYNIGYRTGKQEAKSTLTASLAREQWLAEQLAWIYDLQATPMDKECTADYWLKQAQEAVDE